MAVQKLGAPMTKDFPVFDCDAHVVEPPELWERAKEHLTREELDHLKNSYWLLPGTGQALVNGRNLVHSTHRVGNSITSTAITGPGVDNKVERALLVRNLNPEHALTPEQAEYVDQKGAWDPRARLKDMDIQGIDQVMTIPSPINEYGYWIENHFGARVWCQVYNDWAYEYCQADPERLFPAAILPVQNVQFAIEELYRVAAKGFRVALIRPIDVHGNYSIQPKYEPLWSAFEETGLVYGMHTFPAIHSSLNESYTNQYSPGELITLTGTTTGTGQMVPNVTGSFIYEGAAWVAIALLSGVFERHPRIRCAVFESNGPSWLPIVLAECDKIFKLYKKERKIKLNRLPSESFYQHCNVGFEGDEDIVYTMPDLFEDIGVWASDVYHHDGSDAWAAMERMGKVELPVSIQRKLMGENARRMYNIPPKLVVRERVTELERPDWWPTDKEIEEAMKPEASLIYGR